MAELNMLTPRRCTCHCNLLPHVKVLAIDQSGFPSSAAPPSIVYILYAARKMANYVL